jgi:hypothetical protein
LAVPTEFANITAAAALRILHAHHRATVKARITHQALAAATIQAAKTETTRIRRKRLRAIEPHPIRRSPGNGAYRSPISPNFDFRDIVNHHFESASADAATSAANVGLYGSISLSIRRWN